MPCGTTQRRRAAGSTTRRRGDAGDVGLLDWDGPSLTSVRPVRVRISCAYPDQPPTSVQFEADPALGSNRTEVHAEILRLVVTSAEFELPVIGESEPLPFATDTIRTIEVRDS